MSMILSVSRTAAFSEVHLRLHLRPSPDSNSSFFVGLNLPASNVSVRPSDRQQYKYSTSINAATNNNDYGSGMDQEAMMESDMLIAVD
jgi:hypothetical protein